MNINEPIYIAEKEIHFSRMHTIFVLASEVILELLPMWPGVWITCIEPATPVRACGVANQGRGKPGAPI